MAKVSSNIFDIGLLSFNDRTDPMHELVPNVVHDEHFILSLLHFSEKISPDIRIVVDGCQCGHMEMFFESSVRHGMDPGLSVYRIPGSIFKRYYAAVTGELFGIVISGKEVRENGKMECRDLSDSSYGSNQTYRFIEFVIGKDKFFDFTFNPVYFVTEVFIDLFEILFSKLPKFRGEQFKLIRIFVDVRPGIDQFSSDLKQYYNFFQYFGQWPVKFHFPVVLGSILSDPFGIHPVIFPSEKAYALGDPYGHFHTEARLFFHELGNNDFAINTRMFQTYKRVGQGHLLIFKQPDKGINALSGVFEYIRGSPIIIDDGYIEEPFRYVDTDEVTEVLFVHNR